MIHYYLHISHIRLGRAKCETTGVFFFVQVTKSFHDGALFSSLIL